MTDEAVDNEPARLEHDTDIEDLAPDADELADEQPEADSRTTPDEPSS